MRWSGLLIALSSFSGGIGLAALPFGEPIAWPALIGAVVLGGAAVLLRRRLRALAPGFGDVPADGREADRTAKIQIDRTFNRVNDRARGYFVMIDGRLAGVLKRGGALTVPVLPGQHEIVLTIDWCRSRPLIVTANGGQTMRLTATPRRALLGIYYASFGYRNYIRVEVAPAEQLTGLVLNSE